MIAIKTKDGEAKVEGEQLEGMPFLAVTRERGEPWVITHIPTGLKIPSVQCHDRTLLSRSIAKVSQSVDPGITDNAAPSPREIKQCEAWIEALNDELNNHRRRVYVEVSGTIYVDVTAESDDEAVTRVTEHMTAGENELPRVEVEGVEEIGVCLSYSATVRADLTIEGPQ